MSSRLAPAYGLQSLTLLQGGTPKSLRARSGSGSKGGTGRPRGCADASMKFSAAFVERHRRRHIGTRWAFLLFHSLGHCFELAGLLSGCRGLHLISNAGKELGSRLGIFFEALQLMLRQRGVGGSLRGDLGGLEV